MHVRDLVGGQHVVTVGPHEEVAKAVRLLFVHNIGGMPVVTPDGGVVGFIGERDIVKTMNGHFGPVRHMQVHEVMRPAAFCDPDDNVETVMQRMTNERVRHLVVRENGQVRGVVSVGDMVKLRLNQLELETAVLRDYVAAHRASG
ncbi:MAG: CBS domain-containing protein [Gemmatimonadaceae bacterium]